MECHVSYLKSAMLILGLSANLASVRPTSAHPRTVPSEETFTGEITRNFEVEYDSMEQRYRYILYDETRKTNYFLDAGRKADQYENKKVEIEGNLEQKNTTIRVDSIKPLN